MTSNSTETYMMTETIGNIGLVRALYLIILLQSYGYLQDGS